MKYAISCKSLFYWINNLVVYKAKQRNGKIARDSITTTIKKKNHDYNQEKNLETRNNCC